MLTSGDDPVEHARALCHAAGSSAVYVADLDAIMQGTPPNAVVLASLGILGLEAWLDAGVHTATDVAAVRHAGAARVVVGTETLRDAAAVATAGAAAILSLDMKDGALLAPPGVWPSDDPEAVAEAAAASGITAILLLDLADVGSNAGPRTLPLLARLRDRLPNVEWLLGGGVRSLDDLRRCRDAGAAGVLAASALHDGRLTPEDLAAFAAGTR